MSDDLSIDYMLNDLGSQIEDINASMEVYLVDRMDALHRQKQALANYDAEMKEIEEMELYGMQRWEEMLESAS